MSNRNRDATRWLRADLGDVVQVVPHAARAGAGEGARVELTDGLRRWSRRLARQRSLAVVRRQLLLGGGVAAVAALAILLAGGARPWWLAVAGGAFALGCGAVAWLRRPSLATSAQLLDRELATHDRLGTALELQAAGASGGLAGVVRGEADAAIGRSLQQARAVLTPAGREWAWLAVVVCALAVLIAVPRGGTALTSRPGPTPGSQLSPPNQVVRPGAGSAGSQRSATNVQTSTTPGSKSGVPLASPGHNGAANPYKYSGKQYTNPNAPTAIPQGDLQKPPKINLTSIGNGNASGGSGRGSGGSSSDSSGKSGAASHSGAGQGGKLGSQGGGGAGAGGLKPAAGGGNGGSTPGSGQGSGAAQGSQHGTGAAPSGGGSAGSARAPALGRSSGITAAGNDRSAALPLQGGFDPVAGKGTGAKLGQQTQQAGGGGASRTATVGANGAGGSGSFAALAPTFNSPSGNSSITSYYFGTANQLQFKGW